MTPAEGALLDFIKACLEDDKGISEQAYTHLQTFVNTAYHEGYFHYKIVDLLCDILEKTRITDKRHYLPDR